MLDGTGQLRRAQRAEGESLRTVGNVVDLEVLPAEGYDVLGALVHRRFGASHEVHLLQVNTQILAAGLRGEPVRLRSVELSEVLAELLEAEVLGEEGGATRDILAEAVLANELAQQPWREWTGSAESFLDAHAREHAALEAGLELDEVLELIREEIGVEAFSVLTIAAAEVISDLLEILPESWARVQGVGQWRGDRYRGEVVCEDGELRGLALVRGIIVCALHGGGMIELSHPLQVGDELVVVSAGWVLAEGEAYALSASELSDTYEGGTEEMVFADAPRIGPERRRADEGHGAEGHGAEGRSTPR